MCPAGTEARSKLLGCFVAMFGKFLATCYYNDQPAVKLAVAVVVAVAVVAVAVVVAPAGWRLAGR